MEYNSLFNILLNLEVDDLLNACSFDQQSKSICDRQSFWVAYFKKRNVPLLEKHGDRLGYISEYKWTILVQENTNIILNNINFNVYTEYHDEGGFSGGIFFDGNTNSVNNLVLRDEIKIKLNDIFKLTIVTEDISSQVNIKKTSFEEKEYAITLDIGLNDVTEYPYEAT